MVPTGPSGSDGFRSSSRMDPQLWIWIGSSLCIGSADDNPTNPQISTDDRMDSADSTIECSVAQDQVRPGGPEVHSLTPGQTRVNGH